MTKKGFAVLDTCLSIVTLMAAVFYAFKGSPWRELFAGISGGALLIYAIKEWVAVRDAQ